MLPALVFFMIGIIELLRGRRCDFSRRPFRNLHDQRNDRRFNLFGFGSAIDSEPFSPFSAIHLEATSEAQATLLPIYLVSFLKRYQAHHLQSLRCRHA